VKRQEKTKVQEAILTAFTFFTQFSGSAILLGWSDPTGGVGHGTRPKTGVAPAQHGVLPVAKFFFLSQVNSSFFCTYSIAKVNARVTGRVTRVFHAAFTPCA